MKQNNCCSQACNTCLQVTYKLLAFDPVNYVPPHLTNSYHLEEWRWGWCDKDKAKSCPIKSFTQFWLCQNMDVELPIYIEKEVILTFNSFYFVFYFGSPSRAFKIHRTVRKGGGCLFNSSLPLPPASQTIRH